MQEMPPRNEAFGRLDALTELQSHEGALVSAVEQVADDRVAGMREMRADLVTPSRARHRAHDAAALETGEHDDIRDRARAVRDRRHLPRHAARRIAAERRIDRERII